MPPGGFQVDNHETWKASVVYGDTDSLFIELPGRSLEEAHRIGREMASAVTRSCPPDVVLKFEKVRTCSSVGPVFDW